MQPRLNITDLHTDLLAYFFSFLTINDMKNVSRVCKQFHTSVKKAETRYSIKVPAQDGLHTRKGTYAEVIIILQNRKALEKQLHDAQPNQVEAVMDSNVVHQGSKWFLGFSAMPSFIGGAFLPYLLVKPWMKKEHLEKKDGRNVVYISPGVE